MKDVLVSVIVPAYNSQKYISECLDSLIKQTFDSYEIIVIDDGSTDNTPLICDEYANKNSNMRVFHEENKGVSEARNLGIFLANGIFVTFVDSDDYVRPEFISKLYNAILSTNDCDISMCYLEKHYYDKGKLIEIVGPEFMISKIMDEDLFWTTKFGMKGVLNLMTNKMIRKSLFDNLKFQGVVYEDSRMIHKLVKQARNVIIIPEVLYSLRRYNESLTYRTNNLTIWEANYDVAVERFVDFYERKKYKIALNFLNSCIFCIMNILKYVNLKTQKNKFKELRELKFKWGGLL